MGNKTGVQQHSVSVDALKASLSGDSLGSEVKYANITVELIRAAAEETGATEEQLEFLQAWLDTVYAQALPHTIARGRQLFICTDLGHMEVSIDGPCSKLGDILRQFVAECEVQAYTMTELMQQALDETQVTTMTLWCRLKRIGSDAVGADAGYSLAANLDWMVADLLMPPTRDHDLFREHSDQELLKPVVYGSSIFPDNPERHLGVEMHGLPKRALLTAFFFFKALGFTKPEDSTVHLMASCPADQFTVVCSSGPRGLTRMTLRLTGPRRPIAEELAQTCSGFEYNKAILDKVTTLGQAEPNVIDYIAEARGYAVAVGWTA